MSVTLTAAKASRTKVHWNWTSSTVNTKSEAYISTAIGASQCSQCQNGIPEELPQTDMRSCVCSLLSWTNNNKVCLAVPTVLERRTATPQKTEKRETLSNSRWCWAASRLATVCRWHRFFPNIMLSTYCNRCKQGMTCFYGFVCVVLWLTTFHSIRLFAICFGSECGDGVHELGGINWLVFPGFIVYLCVE